MFKRSYMDIYCLPPTIYIYMANFIVVTLSLMGVKSIPCFGWLCELDQMLVAEVTNS